MTLKNGKHFLVDKSDYDNLRNLSWYIAADGYVVAESGNRRKGERKTFHMHRMILNAKPGEQVDHRNTIRHDNRRSNLRFSSKSTNGMNRGKQSNNKSGYKGVCWTKQRNKWRVTINKNKKQYHVGFFHDIEEAAKAYISAAKKMHGEFANH